MDEGFHSDLQEGSAAHLEKQLAFVHQDRSDGASDRELCLSVAGFSLRVTASILGGCEFVRSRRCRSHVDDRPSDFRGHDGVDHSLLSLCAKGTPSRRLETRDLFFPIRISAWDWLVDQ